MCERALTVEAAVSLIKRLSKVLEGRFARPHVTKLNVDVKNVIRRRVIDRRSELTQNFWTVDLYIEDFWVVSAKFIRSGFSLKSTWKNFGLVDAEASFATWLLGLQFQSTEFQLT